MSESIGSLYPTQIPALSESADIQTALRLYHYGASTEPTEANVSINSIAGRFKDIYAQIAAGTETLPENLGSSENLNTKIATGVYSQNSTTDARSGTNYPTYNGLAYAGLLTVVIAESVVFQTYQIDSVELTSGGGYFWRSKNAAGTWSAWAQVADLTHTHDDRYYTETQMQTSGGASVHPDNINAAISIVKGGTGATTVDAARTNIEIFNRQTAVTSGNDRTPYSGKIYVADPAIVGTTGANIDGAAVGDLWFW